ncbi:MAG: helix-turn-helix transcriptional regulator [Lachnospiraceae bacterium]|nr:helix-turn-helix transcriptional regulator [Lachnospiraceae bacterium]
MILADKIINERKRNGWSQEELAEQLNVSRQSISKWESAQAIPDIQKIIRMAEIFGVSTDYLLKDEMEPEDTARPAISEDSGTATECVKVSMEEANEFLELEQRLTPRLANMVSLCILGPAVLILCIALSQIPGFPLKDTTMVAIGLTAMFIMISVAVTFFVIDSLRMNRFSYLENSPIETMYGVSGMVKERKALFEQTKITLTAIGVVLCVVSVIPLVATSVIGTKEYVIVLMVVLLLVLVAIGVNLLVRVGTISGAFEKLLQEGDYTLRAKSLNMRYASLSTVFWLIATGAYLAWSFISGHWEYTWVLWPIAAGIYICIKRVTHGRSGYGHFSRLRDWREKP